MGQSAPGQQVAPLLWVPWYATEVTDRNGILWFWPIIQDVCQLPDPSLLPSLEREWDIEGIGLMRRYTGVARRLVAATLFRGEGRVRLNLVGGSVEKVVPADDATLGFAALFRQLFSQTEEASFDTVRKLLSRGAHESDSPEFADVVRLWRDAHGTLLKYNIHSLLETMARAGGLHAPAEGDGSTRPFVSEEIAPRDLIEAFLYGDHLHYGKGRELLERWRADDAVAALMEVNMLAGSLMLAHFYAGFAGVVRVVLEGAGQAPNN